MVYKWEQHRETCYRLYVEENRPMDEVVKYMREHHNFTPRCVVPSFHFRVSPAVPRTPPDAPFTPFASVLPYCVTASHTIAIAHCTKSISAYHDLPAAAGVPSKAPSAAGDSPTN